MEFAVIALTAICLALVGCIIYIHRAGQAERKDLHDRILSMLSPEAMLVKSSLAKVDIPRPSSKKDEESDVYFVDEQKEVELMEQARERGADAKANSV